MAESREAELGRAFVELADTLVNDFDVVELLHGLAGRCVELADVEAAGLALVDQTGSLRVVASSSEQARLLELFEVQNNEGPCLDSYETGQVVVEDDLETTERWPRFRREALAAGFRSVEAIPLRLRADRIGALNLFRASPGRLTHPEQAVCRALADVATIGILQERTLREARLLAEQLQVALNSRVVIEQAKGVLAERDRVDMGDAFELMRRYARARNLKLADVAAALIDGSLPASQLGVDA